MNRLRPRATAGAPGSVAPITSKSPAEISARYQVVGRCALRCGSLARRGLPLAVSVPSTTQLFEPIDSVVVPPSRKSRTAGSPRDTLCTSAFVHKFVATEDTEVALASTGDKEFFLGNNPCTPFVPARSVS